MTLLSVALMFLALWWAVILCARAALEVVVWTCDAAQGMKRYWPVALFVVAAVVGLRPDAAYRYDLRLGLEPRLTYFVVVVLVLAVAGMVLSLRGHAGRAERR